MGSKVKIETYTDADEIVWLLNEKEIGRSIPHKAIASLETVYEKGDLTAVSYKNGKEINKYTLSSTDVASKIVVAPEKSKFTADNRDLCYFNIFITDNEGKLIADDGSEISCEVTGGTLMGIFGGNPCNEDQFTSNKCHVYRGRALAIVRTDKKGEVSINVSSDNLISGVAKAEAK